MTNDLLAHDHSDLDAALAATQAALAAGDVESSFHNLDGFWAHLAMHIRAENVHLFPTLLLAAEKPEQSAEAPSLATVQTTTAQLRHDHDFFMSELTAAMMELRNLRRSAPTDTSAAIESVRERLTRVCERLEIHNELEETRVYHWAGALLDETEQTNLATNIRRELENLPPRLRKT